MIRTLALPLLLLAGTAFAAEPVPAAEDAAGCPKAEADAAAAPAPEAAKPATRPGATSPVRVRSTGTRGTPRWHSLLPGMFR